MACREKLERQRKFWLFLHEMHLYQSNGESAFKSIGMLLTWGGSIYIHMKAKSSVSPDAFLFFSLGIMLEYTGLFVSEDNNGKPQKILPGILVIANIVVYFFSLIQLIDKVITPEVYSFQLYTSCITVAIICLDALIKICAKVPSDEALPETELNDNT